jgi:dihydroxy-acid dehydratase
MEDFYYAGGLPALIKELMPHLDTSVLTVNQKSYLENYQNSECYNSSVIATLEEPFNHLSGIVVLKGNLCPNGAVIKPSAASKHLMKHQGKAVVFEDIDDYKARIDDPDLEIDEKSIMVLKYVGLKGYPGMPEVGNMGLPPKLLAKGITDMVRISDGRMSGTGFGTVVLHISPEAADGGLLALVQNGDEIILDVENKKLELLVNDKEIKRRKEEYIPFKSPYNRGYAHLFANSVLQPEEGADLDFLKGNSGYAVPRDSH